MEATPAAPTVGVQIRTAGGRVATVTLYDLGWYEATLDDNVDLAPLEGGAGASIKKQRSFFAANQGELLQTVPKVDRSKKKSDTPMRLRDKEGAIVHSTTMRAWSKASGKAVPKGHEPHHKIVVNVPKSWTTAKWSPSAGARPVHYATVDGHKVELDGPASTARGADGRHVLDIDRLKFRPRGDIRDQSDKKTIGTDARQSHWKEGAAGNTGDALRPLLEANPSDTPGLIEVASNRYVGPALQHEQDRLVEGCHLARNTVATFKGQLQFTFGGYTEAEANRAAGVWSIACALDHLKGEFDDSPIFDGLSDELQDAARKARAGEPWKDQNLGRYLVRVLSEREQAALDQYREKCRRLGRTPRIGKTPVAPSEKSWDDANKREGRGRHSLVRLSVELEHQHRRRRRDAASATSGRVSLRLCERRDGSLNAGHARIEGRGRGSYG